MDVVVVGPGSLGCVAAAALTRAGHRVVLYGRGETVERLKRDGVVVHGLEEWDVLVPATADARDLGEPDLLLICTKALGTRELLHDLARGYRAGGRRRRNVAG